MDLHHIKNNWNSKQVDTNIYIYLFIYLPPKASKYVSLSNCHH